MTTRSSDYVVFCLSALFEELCSRPWELPTPLVETPKRAADEIHRLTEQNLKLTEEVTRLQWALQAFVDYCKGDDRRTMQWIHDTSHQLLLVSKERMEEL